MDKRTRAKLNIKNAQADGNAAKAWWELENTNFANNAPQPQNDISNNTEDTDGLSTELFAASTTNIDPDVQNRVITLVSIIKELALKFYQLTLSDTEALKIAKENLKDISSRIAHIPVDDLTDAIDNHINKIDKGSKPAEESQPANKPQEPNQNAPQQEAAPAPVENAPSFGGEPKMASKQASETEERIRLKEVWLTFVDLMEQFPELEPVYNQMIADFGPTPFLSNQFLYYLKNYINEPELRLQGFSRRLVKELEANGLPSRWLKVDSTYEPMYEDEYGNEVRDIKAFEPGPFDREPKGMKEYYKEKQKEKRQNEREGVPPWASDPIKLASYYNDEKQAINRHFNVETLQQFINVVKYNQENFEYFLKNNSNSRKNITPW